MLYLQMLPFMEGSTIKDAYNFNVGTTNANNLALLSREEPMLRCPSAESYLMVVAGNGDRGGDRKASYGFNYGYGTYAQLVTDQPPRTILGKSRVQSGIADTPPRLNITVLTRKR